MSRKLPVSVALAITIIAMTVTFAITWIVSMNTFDNTVRSVTQLQAQYSKLAEIDTYVRANYYGEIDDNALFDRVASGYVTGLGDRYGVYYTEREYTELQNIENGTLVGIGLEILRETDGTYRIVRVYDGSAAARAGVTAGGAIVRVDGVERRELAGVSALKSLLRGEEGTELALHCVYDVVEEKDFTIRRIAFTTPTVESQILGDYAYIRISAFGPNTYTDFDYAVRLAQAAEVKGLVFDVRNNNTGAARYTRDIIDMLCPQATVARRENRNGTTTVLITSDENAVELPMVVLVNGGTGGMAELFAVSVRDLCGGQIVGTRTMGHGTLQSSPQRLSDGSAISVTYAKLLTSTGESFDLVGVTPGIEVDGTNITETMLLNPNPASDTQIYRALEVARSMVLATGADAGTIDVGQGSGVDASDTSDASGTGDGSETSDGSDASDTGDESGGDASASDDSGAESDDSGDDSDSSTADSSTSG